MQKTGHELREVLRLGWVLGKNSYRLIGIGSRAGKLWPTIGLALRVALIGLVFGLVLDTRPVDYLPWLATGWAVWAWISGSITGGTECLNSNKSLMLTLPLRKQVFALEVVIKDFMLLVQNLLVVMPVVLILERSINFVLLLAIPGVLITAAFLVGLGWMLAPLAARFKDIGPLVSSLVGVMFFVLPIMWQPDRIDNELVHLILGLNPLYHYLQITRLPLLMEVPTAMNYLLAVLGGVVSLLVGHRVMRSLKSKLIYWI